MIRVGIYLHIPNPEAGGATTLLQSIKNEIDVKNGNYSVVYLFRGGKNQPYKREDDQGIYINIDRASKKYQPLIRLRKMIYLKKNPNPPL